MSQPTTATASTNEMQLSRQQEEAKEEEEDLLRVIILGGVGEKKDEEEREEDNHEEIKVPTTITTTTTTAVASAATSGDEESAITAATADDDDDIVIKLLEELAANQPNPEAVVVSAPRKPAAAGDAATASVTLPVETTMTKKDKECCRHDLVALEQIEVEKMEKEEDHLVGIDLADDELEEGGLPQRSGNEQDEREGQDATSNAPVTTAAQRSIRRAPSLPGAYRMVPSQRGGAAAVASLEEDATLNGVLEAIDIEQPEPLPPPQEHIHTGNPLGAVLHLQRARVRVLRHFLPSHNNDHHRQQEEEEQQHEEAVDVKVVPGIGKRWVLSFVLGVPILLLVIVLLILGLLGVYSEDATPPPPPLVLPLPGSDTTTHSPSSSSTTLSTLEHIRQRGYLKCDLRPMTPEIERYSASFCEAISAAIFGSSVPPPTFSLLDATNPFHLIASHEIDIMTSGFTQSMERQIYEGLTHAAFSFAVPAEYAGATAAGDSFYIHECVEHGWQHVGNCSGLKVCVTNQTTYQDFMEQVLPQQKLQLFPSYADTASGFLNGSHCNVIITPMLMLPALASAEGNENMVISDIMYKFEPMGVVSRANDREFSDFVDAVVQALLVAAKHNITQATADLFPQTNVFGEDNKDIFRNVLRAVGNYHEMCDRSMGVLCPTDGMRAFNDGSTGLLYYHPWGGITSTFRDAEASPLGPSLEGVLQQGVVRCGVRTQNRPGFATRHPASANGTNTSLLEGFEIDLCRAVASSLFQGWSAEHVEYVELDSQRDGFVKLANGQVDVVAGATRTLENDVREPATGLGFAFTMPYFYGYSEDEDNLCLVTMQDENDWYSFVYSVFEATIYAEDFGIQDDTSNRMPELYFFGEQFHRMFRDAILAVGSYKDIYERNLEPFHPRGGRNVLNKVPNEGGQHYIVPGYI